MIGEPLVEVGADQVTVALPLPAVAVTPAGASGAPTMICVDCSEFGPVPIALRAATANM